MNRKVSNPPVHIFLWRLVLLKRAVFYPLQQELFTYNTNKTQQDTPKLIHVPYVRSPFSYSFLVRFESTHR